MEVDRDQTTVTETRTLYAFAGTPVATRTHTSAATTFLFQNHLGSTVAAYDDTTNSLIQQYYYPYGAERHAVGSLPVDQRYTGQTTDNTGANSGDTGLLYYNARYYDPDTGAFVAADTIIPTVGLSVGFNRYAYVNDTPVNRVDPSGNATIQMTQYITGDARRAYARPGADVPVGVGIDPQTVFYRVQAQLDRGSGFGGVWSGLLTSLGLGTALAGDALESRKLRAAGALMSSAPGLAKAAGECLDGHYASCASGLGETASSAAAAWIAGLGVTLACGVSVACLAVGVGVGIFASSSGGDIYRAVSRYLGATREMRAGPGFDPYRTIGTGGGLYRVVPFGGGVPGLAE